ncbi:MAG: energy transducer TonB [Acidobacteriia bacterium]|nr:energy transducer TonB [Terriglobia bacterium]
MTRLFPHGRLGSGLLALLLVCAGGTPYASGQSSAPVQPPIVLDRSEALRLVEHEVVPDYPSVAKVNFIQGQVRLVLEVGSDGKVNRAHVMYGNPVLAAAALEAVRSWRYRPYQTPAGPHAFLTTINMNFKLRNGKHVFLPPEPERDFDRQVTPPEVTSKSSPDRGRDVVRLRLLLNDEGEVIDSEPLRGSVGELGAALKSLAHWTFRPARWGTIHLPSYIVVEVPVIIPSTNDVVADPAGR